MALRPTLCVFSGLAAAVVLGCKSPSSPQPDAGTAQGTGGGGGPLGFAGIASVELVGKNGLQASWVPPPVPGDARYTLSVQTGEGAEVDQVQTSETSAVVSDLPEGEYVLRVTAHIGGENDDGGAALHQLIGDNRIVYRSGIPLPGAADVWGRGNLIGLAGFQSNLSFLLADVSDVQAPKIVAEVSGYGGPGDIKIAGDLLFINNEAGVGAHIFDITDPAKPVALQTLQGVGAASIHNLFVDRGYLYMTDNEGGGVQIVDIRNPASPRKVTTWMPPRNVVHDQAVIDGKMYVAFWDGFAIVDVSDPAKPRDLVVHLYTGATSECHNVWPAHGGDYVLTTDEIEGGHIRVFDVRDPNNVAQVSEWMTDPGHIVHNVLVRDNYAFVAYYVAGLRVLDISDPTKPIEVGFYDPETVTQGFDGTWGVWPFGEHVAVGSLRQGLMMVDFFPPIVTRDPEAPL
jgi:choice-of-anchor B domain-containing protein